jgi:hypothetical protein
MQRVVIPTATILTRNVRETANRLGYQIVMGESVGDALFILIPNGCEITGNNLIETGLSAI